MSDTTEKPLGDAEAQARNEEPSGAMIHGRRAAEVLGHLVLFALAYLGAFLLRFDFRIPPQETEIALLPLPSSS